jgi:hypothetical protein
MEMRRRKHSEATIRTVVYENPIDFLSQSPKFHLQPAKLPELAEVGI